MGYIARDKKIAGDKPSGSGATQTHEGAGCEDDYLHTPGGVELRRGGRTVFATREEAEGDSLLREKDEASRGGEQKGGKK